MACALLATACGSTAQRTDAPRPESSSTAPIAVAGRVDEQQCATAPPKGELTKPQGPFRFSRGEVAVSVRRLPPPLAPDRTPGESGAASTIGCFRYPHWGPADPVLPVESVVMAFRDSATDGVLLEMSLPDFVSRPRLVGQVGVVIEGRHYQASSCSVETTVLTETRAAGLFTCPSAVLAETNPFAPDDDIAPSDRSPEPTTQTPAPPAPPGLPPTAPPPATETAAPSATITGWYRLGS
ncbi:hypothetical protein [uncultured Williamsia sp.]|uniref:hypothetical protein n=1 Tax=uncultured Williamsia sp. TaxID=259311 RepID=UPI002610D806|nr:hypothetical protein [uncultured Williamsia sp.]